MPTTLAPPHKLQGHLNVLVLAVSCSICLYHGCDQGGACRGATKGHYECNPKWSVRQYQKEFTTVLQKGHILILFYSSVLLLNNTVYKHLYYSQRWPSRHLSTHYNYGYLTSTTRPTTLPQRPSQRQLSSLIPTYALSAYYLKTTDYTNKITTYYTQASSPA